MRIPYRAALVTILIAAACGGGGPQPQTPAAESPGPALVVERFLRAANANDLATMTHLFGSKDRSIVELEGQTRAERRMYVIASLLRHDDWSIRGQETVPGRIFNATELMVRLEMGERAPVVPFLVVRQDDGGWIIERIGLETVTRVEQGGG